MSTKSKSTKAKKQPPASIVWFEIPADDTKRAKKFYSSLFGWKIKAFPVMDEYYHIDTGAQTPFGYKSAAYSADSCAARPSTLITSPVVKGGAQCATV